MKRHRTVDDEHHQELQLENISTIDDGRCAYGGFALGLIDMVFHYPNYFRELAAQGTFDYFIQIHCGENATWETFVNYLEQNRANKVPLQKALATSFKRLLHVIMSPPPVEVLLPENAEDIEWQAVDDQLNAIQHNDLMTLFRDFSIYLDDPNTIDSREAWRTLYSDVYMRCDAVRAKFKAIRQKYVLNSADAYTGRVIARYALYRWMCDPEQGFGTFRDYVTNVDDFGSWGGSAELRLLATYFRIGVYRFRRDNTPVYLSSGRLLPIEEFADVQPAHLDYLRRFMIISPYAENGHIEVCVTDRDDIDHFCSALSPEHFQKVVELWQLAQAYKQRVNGIEGVPQGALITIEQFVEANLPIPLRRQLINRGVVHLWRQVNRVQICMESLEDLQVIYQGIPADALAQIKQILLMKNGEHPFIYLRNNWVHYTYERNPIMARTWPELTLRPVMTQAQSQLSFFPPLAGAPQQQGASVCNALESITQQALQRNLMQGLANALVSTNAALADQCIAEIDQLQQSFEFCDISYLIENSLSNYFLMFKGSGNVPSDILSVILLHYANEGKLPSAMMRFINIHRQEVVNSAKDGLLRLRDTIVLGLRATLGKCGPIFSATYCDSLNQFVQALGIIAFDDADFSPDSLNVLNINNFAEGGVYANLYQYQMRVRQGMQPTLVQQTQALIERYLHASLAPLQNLIRYSTMLHHWIERSNQLQNISDMEQEYDDLGFTSMC